MLQRLTITQPHCCKTTIAYCLIIVCCCTLITDLLVLYLPLLLYYFNSVGSQFLEMPRMYTTSNTAVLIKNKLYRGV